MNASKAKKSEVMNSKNDLLKQLAIDSTLFEATLSHEILKQYLGLIEVLTSLPFSFRDLKEIEGTGGNVSISDIIAYQIGWGTCLIRWYAAGIKQEVPEMPGEGFSNWHYVTIAHHFYQKYQLLCSYRSMPVGLVEKSGIVQHLMRKPLDHCYLSI